MNRVIPELGNCIQKNGQRLSDIFDILYIEFFPIHEKNLRPPLEFNCFCAVPLLLLHETLQPLLREGEASFLESVLDFHEKSVLIPEWKAHAIERLGLAVCVN
jgi:hypothetical protein